SNPGPLAGVGSGRGPDALRAASADEPAGYRLPAPSSAPAAPGGADPGLAGAPALAASSAVAGAPRPSSPCRIRSAKASATSAGLSGPSGEYHWYAQLTAERASSAANRGSTARNSPR